MDTINEFKTTLFCDCYIKYKCFTNATDAQMKERFWFRYGALCDLIEALGLTEEYTKFIEFNENL